MSEEIVEAEAIEPTGPNLEPMEFKLERLVVPVKLIDPETNKADNYELREATGADATKFRDFIVQRTKLGPNGKPQSMGAIAGSEPMLVSMCLFYGDTNKNVPENVVRKWPARIQKELFQRAKEISGLKEELEGDDEDSAKNEPDDTTDGSS